MGRQSSTMFVVNNGHVIIARSQFKSLWYLDIILLLYNVYFMIFIKLYSPFESEF
jgi:hypothetical protein